jgi:hypothetical protein
MKIGLIGCGFVGGAIKKAYETYNIDILVYDPYIGYDIDFELIKSCDVVFILNDEEKFLKNKEWYFMTEVVELKISQPYFFHQKGEYYEQRSQYFKNRDVAFEKENGDELRKNFEDRQEYYKKIKEFVKGTIAENSPIIPVSAQQEINLDKILETLCKIEIPERNIKEKPIFLIARSFDVNKPGTEIENLKGNR